MLSMIGLAALAIAPSPKLPEYISGTPREVLADWLVKHSEFQLLRDEDCGCADDLNSIRSENKGYHPYFAIGDFDGDGLKDFAVVVSVRGTAIRRVQIFSATEHGYLRFLSTKISTGSMLFFGPPRPRPYRLLVGAYESEGAIFVPLGGGRYRMQW